MILSYGLAKKFNYGDTEIEMLLEAAKYVDTDELHIDGGASIYRNQIDKGHFNEEQQKTIEFIIRTHDCEPNAIEEIHIELFGYGAKVERDGKGWEIARDMERTFVHRKNLAEILRNAVTIDRTRFNLTNNKINNLNIEYLKHPKAKKLILAGYEINLVQAISSGEISVIDGIPVQKRLIK